MTRRTVAEATNGVGRVVSRIQVIPGNRVRAAFTLNDVWH
jgi:hypothetical protein